MKTVKVDSTQRVRIPDVKPGQVFAYQNNGDGSRTLTEVKAEAKEPFPPGSLLKYITPEWNRELSALAKGSSLAVPDDE